MMLHEHTVMLQSRQGSISLLLFIYLNLFFPAKFSGYEMRNQHSLQQDSVVSVYFNIMCQNGTKVESEH